MTWCHFGLFIGKRSGDKINLAKTGVEGGADFVRQLYPQQQDAPHDGGTWHLLTSPALLPLHTHNKVTFGLSFCGERGVGKLCPVFHVDK